MSLIFQPLTEGQTSYVSSLKDTWFTCYFDVSNGYPVMYFGTRTSWRIFVFLFTLSYVFCCRHWETVMRTSVLIIGLRSKRPRRDLAGSLHHFLLSLTAALRIIATTQRTHGDPQSVLLFQFVISKLTCRTASLRSCCHFCYRKPEAASIACSWRCEDCEAFIFFAYLLTSLPLQLQ